MNIKVYQNRETHQIDNDVYGTQNENKVTTLKIEVPEEYENWNKRIVYTSATDALSAKKGKELNEKITSYKH